MSSIVFATANITSADPRQSAAKRSVGLNCTGRMAELEAQFSAAGFLVVAVQEGRVPSRTVLSGNTFRMLVVEGVGTTHSLGLQLWVHKCSFAAIGPVTVVSPRIMCLNLKMHDKRDTIRIKVINAHAPRFGIEDDNIHDQFYHELGETVCQVPPGWVVILLGDMNANLGDSESLGVGSFSEDHENDNGTRLRAFAAECNMAFMNTFFDDVPLSTWRASRDQEHRIDFTAISMKDISRVVHAGVCKDINMAFSTKIDHWSAAMQVRMCPPKRTAVKNTSRWDRAAMKDVSLVYAFRNELQSTLTTRARDLDGARRPFQRLQLLNNIVHEVGSRYFSPPMCGPRKQWVSQRAFELMKEA